MANKGGARRGAPLAAPAGPAAAKTRRRPPRAPPPPRPRRRGGGGGRPRGGGGGGAGRGGGRWVAVVAVAALASAGGALALPAVLGGAIDALVKHGDVGPWLKWCALLVALMVAAEMLDSLAAGAANARSTAWLRHDL